MTDAEHDGLEACGKLKRTDYERRLARPHVEFVKLQQWVVHKWLKACIVFEGRGGAGKGSAIKAMPERLEARVDDGRTIWMRSDMDLESYSRWFDYSRTIICRQRFASSSVEKPIAGSTPARLYQLRS